MPQPRDIPAPMFSQWALFPTRLYGMMGCNANSGAVGHPLKTSAHPAPECEQVGLVSGTQLSKYDGLMWCSEVEDAKYCQPCGHSPGSTWTSHEPTMIQHVRCFLQIPQTHSWRFGHVVDNLSCVLRQSLLEHRQRVRPRCPESWSYPPCTMAMRPTATPPLVARRSQTAHQEGTTLHVACLRGLART